MATYYAQRASAGLLFTEGSNTSILARGWYNAPDAFTEQDIKAWRIVTDAVHERGGRIFCQLYHSGRASHSSFRDGFEEYEAERKVSIAPSAIKKPSSTGKQSFTMRKGEVDIETPREMTAEEVESIPGEFRDAARVAKQAGFDGVELHCANGFLLDQFLQSCTNERIDMYGGSFENRFRLIEKVVKEVLTVFESHQISVRLSPNAAYNGMGSKDFRESFTYYARKLNELEVGFLHLVIGLEFGTHGHGEPMKLEEFRRVFDGVIIANLGYSAETAEREISDGGADMVSFGRLYLSNPDLVERFAKGAKLNEDAPHEVYYSSVEKEWGAEGLLTFKTMAEQNV